MERSQAESLKMRQASFVWASARGSQEKRAKKEGAIRKADLSKTRPSISKKGREFPNDGCVLKVLKEENGKYSHQSFPSPLWAGIGQGREECEGRAHGKKRLDRGGRQ